MPPRARPYNAEPPCTRSVQGGFLFLPRGGTGTPARTHICAAAGAHAHSRAAAGQLVEQAIHVGI